MFVDRTRIQVQSGSGGRGCVSFRREKYVPKGGPDGGDGGKGGSVWLRVNPHRRTLLDVRESPHQRALGGDAGSGNNRTGKTAEDLVVWLPPGTVVRDAETQEILADLVDEGSEFLAARGGRGGRGNARFKSARNQAPRRADPGEPGEMRWLELELKLIADVGLVGMPNAGKSTLLSRISRARPKIAAYPFTTLEPGLGIARLDEERQFVVADIPGLIEGASEGKGLGHQFLRHVERTRVLALLVDVTSEDPRAEADLVERELEEYSATLAGKPRVRVLTKADLVPPDQHAQAVERAGIEGAMLVSAHSGEGVDELLEALWRRIDIPTPAESGSHDDG